jgi:hypothetical protein
VDGGCTSGFICVGIILHELCVNAFLVHSRNCQLSLSFKQLKIQHKKKYHSHQHLELVLDQVGPEFIPSNKNLPSPKNDDHPLRK